MIHTDDKIRSIALSLLSYLKSPGISDKQHSWVNCFTDLEKKEFIQELQMAIENVPPGEDWSEVQEIIECWQETAEIVSDKELLTGIKESLEEIRRGETISWEDVKKELDLV